MPSEYAENSNSSHAAKPDQSSSLSQKSTNLDTMIAGVKELAMTRVNQPPAKTNAYADQVNSQLDLLHASVASQIANARGELDRLETKLNRTIELAKSAITDTAAKATTVLNAADTLSETIRSLGDR